jgi:hypothetical protein
MRRIRPRSVYDVFALVSFFLVIGGGTALASYVVSSNSQVGPNTISGHKPPSGNHANIIGGSVNATDLANGAATLSKLAPGSVNSSKVVNGSLTAADIAGDTIGAGQLAPVGDVSNLNTAPIEAVPFVIRFHVSLLIDPNSSRDGLIYDANAPQGFTVIDAWTDQGSTNPDQSWELRNAANGGGDALTDPQPAPTSQITRLSGTLHTDSTVPKNGSMVVRVTNPSPATAAATFDLYVLAMPAP